MYQYKLGIYCIIGSIIGASIGYMTSNSKKSKKSIIITYSILSIILSALIVLKTIEQSTSDIFYLATSCVLSIAIYKLAYFKSNTAPVAKEQDKKEDKIEVEEAANSTLYTLYNQPHFEMDQKTLKETTTPVWVGSLREDQPFIPGVSDKHDTFVTLLDYFWKTWVMIEDNKGNLRLGLEFTDVDYTPNLCRAKLLLVNTDGSLIDYNVSQCGDHRYVCDIPYYQYNQDSKVFELKNTNIKIDSIYAFTEQQIMNYIKPIDTLKGKTIFDVLGEI